MTLHSQNISIFHQGEKEKNIEDVHEFNLVLPTLEYHNRIWTWFDLLMAMKNDSKRVLLSQVNQRWLNAPFFSFDRSKCDCPGKSAHTSQLWTTGNVMLTEQRMPAVNC